MSTVSNLANNDVITETWVDSVKDGLNTGVFSGTYSPTLSGITVGTGGSQNTANYAYVGGILVVSGIIQLGTTGASAPTSANLITLPSGFVPAPAVAPNYLRVGLCSMLAGGVSAEGLVALLSTTQVRLYALGAGATYAAAANLSSSVPGTWSGAANDYIRYSYTIPGTMT